VPEIISYINHVLIFEFGKARIGIVKKSALLPEQMRGEKNPKLFLF
jgi:hypothetical protein